MQNSIPCFIHHYTLGVGVSWHLTIRFDHNSEGYDDKTISPDSYQQYGHKSLAIKVAVEIVICVALSELGGKFDILLNGPPVGSNYNRLLFPSSGWKHVMWFLMFVIFPKYFSLV